MGPCVSLTSLVRLFSGSCACTFWKVAPTRQKRVYVNIFWCQIPYQHIPGVWLVISMTSRNAISHAEQYQHTKLIMWVLTTLQNLENVQNAVKSTCIYIHICIYVVCSIKETKLWQNGSHNAHEACPAESCVWFPCFNPGVCLCPSKIDLGIKCGKSLLSLTCGGI